MPPTDIDDRETQEDLPPTTSTPPTAHGGGNQLVRVTVNLIPAAMAALERLSEHGATKTDVINRALQIAGLVQEIMDRDGGHLKIKRKDGSEETIYIL
jgi:hypothetical protein